MASGESVQRKKRAWRKPREAIGPGVLETSSETKPKLARFGQREQRQTSTCSSCHGSETMGTAAEIVGANGEETERSSSGMMRNRNGTLEQSHESKDGGAELSTSLSSMASTAAVVEIDGSVLEGVSCLYYNYA